MLPKFIKLRYLYCISCTKYLCVFGEYYFVQNDIIKPSQKRMSFRRLWGFQLFELDFFIFKYKECIMTKEEWYDQLFNKLDNSKFRSSFHLKQKDINYINEKGLDTIRLHAKDFIAKREAPAYIPNDRKQTPMRGHPVFLAQHATATCCRECIRKWHKMQPGKELSQVQQDYLVDVIMTWIKRDLERNKNKL